MKRTLSAISLGVIMLTACGGDNSKSAQSSPQAGSSTIGITIARNDDNSPFLQKVYGIFDDEIKANPQIKAVLSDANNSQDKQYADMDKMIDDKVGAIIINLADPNKGAEMIGKYCGKVPLVFYNFDPTAKAMAKCESSYFVDTKPSTLGVSQAMSVLSHWQKHPEWDKNKDGKIQVAILSAVPNEESSDARTKWAVSTIETHPDYAVPVQTLFQDYAFYQTHLAKDVANKWLSSPQFADVEVVLSASDSMALGLLSALKEKGMRLPIFSIDNLPVVQSAMTSGDIISSANPDMEGEIQTALTLADNLAKGQPPLTNITHLMEHRVIRVLPVVDSVDK